MRNKFIANKNNDLIYWKWKTDSISTRNCTPEKIKELEEIISRIGLPNEDEHKWRNCEYSCEYNDCLNKALKMNLIHITWDSEYGPYMDFDEWTDVICTLLYQLKRYKSDEEMVKFILNRNLQNYIRNEEKLMSLLNEFEKN